ncbi:hypothetical protein HNP46_007202 [Pseudomonas nitritireducens]|uniref:Uncharacterized protein n=1 Tax=Pseudomonas nitroreducens TaxID=46680 RepID=A0A7W7P5R7_PSENT|nr:hypothetical protein [Pseudomonas nitritireducens]MBB4868279.1 hypothetical protein [Pseudomonas nitritireducens]
MGIYVVVANQFEDFSKHANLMSYGALLKAFKGHGRSTLKGIRFVAGQGLGHKEIQHVYRQATALGYTEELEHWRMWTDTVPAGRDISHKHRQENVLISVPEKTDEDTYTSNLLVWPPVSEDRASRLN